MMTAYLWCYFILVGYLGHLGVYVLFSLEVGDGELETGIGEWRLDEMC